MELKKQGKRGQRQGREQHYFTQGIREGLSTKIFKQKPEGSHLG